MTTMRLMLFTSLALLAFAGNSLLCRAALAQTNLDAASFTSVRLISGALVLWLLVAMRGKGRIYEHGDWWSAVALFVYAAGFSFAYLQLNTGIGALILFGAVQLTMIAVGLWRHERFTLLQWAGLLLAASGLVGLLLPGISAPPVVAALLMMAAGIGWGVYSLRGKGSVSPLQVTAGNFVRTVPFTLILSAVFLAQASVDAAGIVYALLSGALTSGVGYAIWYAVLPSLRATTAATLQLSVPVLAALLGIALLAEPLTLRLLVCSVVILGGIALVMLKRKTL